MRIAFVGGKSSGKSTCAALFSRYLAAKGLPVLAIDAAADQRLAALLGRPTPPRYEHVDGMLELTPDGLGPLAHTVTGSRTPRAVCASTARCVSTPAADGVHVVATDTHDTLLDRLADGAGEYVVVDLATGDLASARYDLTVLVSEPTRRSVGLYGLHAQHSAAEHVALRVLGNKISDWGDAARLTEQTGDALVGCVGHSAWVRAAERGTAGSVSGLEPGNTAALAAVRSALDACPRKLQQGDTADVERQQCHPAVMGPAYSASRR